MIYALIFTAFLIIAPDRSIDRELHMSAAEFYEQFPEGIKVNIRSGKLYSKALAMCFIWNNEIVVNFEAVAEHGEDIEAIVWHELGHCSLGLAHDTFSSRNIMYHDKPQSTKEAWTKQLKKKHELTCKKLIKNIVEVILKERNPLLYEHKSCRNIKE